MHQTSFTFLLVHLLCILHFKISELEQSKMLYTHLFLSRDRSSCFRFGRKKTVIVGLVVAFAASIISVFIPDDRSDQGNYVDAFKLFCLRQFIQATKTRYQIRRDCCKPRLHNKQPFVFRIYWWANISRYCGQVFHQYGIFRNLYLEYRIISNIRKVSIYIEFNCFMFIVLNKACKKKENTLGYVGFRSGKTRGVSP